jgi:mRNA-degrading endonuclease RelE of RelBE toxin-antitoxin system
MNIRLSEEFEQTLGKLKRKDPVIFAQVQKKIAQISLLDCASVEHFKNLRGNMSDYKRVHAGSFVLTFQVAGDTITFKRLAHHDKAYR